MDVVIRREVKFSEARKTFEQFVQIDLVEIDGTFEVQRFGILFEPGYRPHQSFEHMVVTNPPCPFSSTETLLQMIVRLQYLLNMGRLTRFMSPIPEPTSREDDVELKAFVIPKGKVGNDQAESLADGSNGAESLDERARPIKIITFIGKAVRENVGHDHGQKFGSEAEYVASFGTTDVVMIFLCNVHDVLVEATSVVDGCSSFVLARDRMAP
jgi:hypothetical protein